jgi:hypothetical protein
MPTTVAPHSAAPAPPLVLEKQRGVVVLGPGQQQSGDRRVLRRRGHNRCGFSPRLAGCPAAEEFLIPDSPSHGTRLEREPRLDHEIVSQVKELS